MPGGAVPVAMASRAEVAELVDALDSKSSEGYTSWGFEPPLRHQKNKDLRDPLCRRRSLFFLSLQHSSIDSARRWGSSALQTHVHADAMNETTSGSRNLRQKISSRIMTSDIPFVVYAVVFLTMLGLWRYEGHYEELALDC